MKILYRMRQATAVAAACLFCLTAKADEGMWLIQAINSALEKNMQERGLALSAKEIYNADAEGATIADAVVSMEFGCTGSMISSTGLLITNHHCAYSDIHALSTDDNNLLEKGFWAMYSSEEIPIRGKEVYFLKRVIDVTDELKEFQAQQVAEGKPSGMRRISHIMENKYAAESGLDAMLSSMWAGTKYYMALYQVYSDVRLVAAPPVALAAFGGDIDNWEWPQHKCDFAMYRVYTAPDGSRAEYSGENVPLCPEKHLKISLQGYRPGDFTMIIGYPGRTSRYSSSIRTEYLQNVSLPITNTLRRRQMDIISRGMESSPEIRLKYSDRFFGLSNVQELYEGEVACLGRFKVVDILGKQEKELQEWIDSDPDTKAKWGGLLDVTAQKYAAVREIRKNQAYYRETVVSGSRMFPIANKARQVKDGNMKPLLAEYAAIDMNVEKELFCLGVCEFFKNVDRKYWGEYHRSLADGQEDFAAIAENLWNGSALSDPERLVALISAGENLEEDPIIKFLSDVKTIDFNRKVSEIEDGTTVLSLDREYTHALYNMREAKGLPQYPDANSTMRITYGTVQSIEPHDAVVCSHVSTARGIMEKYDPSLYDYNIDSRAKAMVESNLDMPVNFINNCDITGGNSGSPVMNARGELIGLAFDGNKESLAGDIKYIDGYNMSVCVDIRYVIHTLREYAPNIAAELGL